MGAEEAQHLCSQRRCPQQLNHGVCGHISPSSGVQWHHKKTREQQSCSTGVRYRIICPSIPSLTLAFKEQRNLKRTHDCYHDRGVSCSFYYCWKPDFLTWAMNTSQSLLPTQIGPPAGCHVRVVWEHHIIYSGSWLSDISSLTLRFLFTDREIRF